MDCFLSPAAVGRSSNEFIFSASTNLIYRTLNIIETFAEHRFMRPKPVLPVKQMQKQDYIENWICYKSRAFSAKELTVLPGRTVTIKDSAAYGLIMMQGHGTMGYRNSRT